LNRFEIQMGDFNGVPSSLPMELIQEETSLIDAWAQCHDSQLLPTPDVVHSAHHAISNFGVSADSPLNSFSAGKTLDDEATRWQGKRLDYILFQGPQHSHVWGSRASRTDGYSEPPSLKCKQCQVVLTERVRGRPFSFSDHFGVAAVLEIATEPMSPQSRRRSNKDHILIALQALTVAYRESRARSRQQLLIFGLSVFSLIGLILGSAFQPITGLNPLMMLLGGIVTWLGTTMLYAGFVFGNWEARALTNVIEEMEARKSSER
jgi:sphingomyelin phosphodiesterase 2